MRISIFTLLALLFESYSYADINRIPDVVFNYVELSDVYQKTHEFLNRSPDIQFKNIKDSHNKIQVYTLDMQTIVTLKIWVNNTTSKVGIAIDEQMGASGELKNRVLAAMNSWEYEASLIEKLKTAIQNSDIQHPDYQANSTNSSILASQLTKMILENSIRSEYLIKLRKLYSVNLLNQKWYIASLKPNSNSVRDSIAYWDILRPYLGQLFRIELENLLNETICEQTKSRINDDFYSKIISDDLADNVSTAIKLSAKMTNELTASAKIRSISRVLAKIISSYVPEDQIESLVKVQVIED